MPALFSRISAERLRDGFDVLSKSAILYFLATLVPTCFFLLAAAAPAAGLPDAVARYATRQGLVEVSVRGPDGRALSSTPIEIIPYEPEVPELEARQSAPLSSATDASGRFRLAWRSGQLKLFVHVRGIGFGATGAFEVRAAETVRPDLPPLAAFARIEGSLDEEIFRSGVKIVARPYRRYLPKRPVAYGPGGQLVIDDVLPGHYDLIVRDGEEILADQPIEVVPGEHREGVVLRKVNYLPLKRYPSENNSEKAVTWVAGVVRDEAGRPLSGVTVYSRVTYATHRLTEMVRSATTNRRGRFAIEGPEWLADHGQSITAFKRGYQPGLASIQYLPEQARGSARPPAPRIALTLGRKGAALTVEVLHDGHPVQDARVSLKPEHGPALFDQRYAGSDMGAQSESLGRQLQTVKQSDPRGLAKFSGLRPTTYAITAIKGSGEDRLGGFAYGVAARIGRVPTFRLSIHRKQRRVRCRVLEPDGRPYSGKAEFSYGTVMEKSPIGTSSKTDESGMAAYTFRSSGLYRVRSTLREFGGVLRKPPLSGEALVAVSAFMPMNETLDLNLEQPGCGSLTVDLQDAAGRPLEGVVIIDECPMIYGVGYPCAAGSTDENGRVRFEDLYPGHFELIAFSSHGRLPRRSVGIAAWRDHHLQIRDQETAHDRPQPSDPPKASRHVSYTSLVRTAVQLSDGKTPAVGASVLVIDTETGEKVAGGYVDASGRVQVYGVEPVVDPKQSVTALAWRWCSHGVTRVALDPGKRVIRLGRPLALTGLVTLAGRKIDARAARIEVKADFEGRDSPAGLYDRSATVQADGRFRLDGMTPGSYRIQAIMDGIWLSPSLAITVGGGRAKPIQLDIGQPGEAVLLELADPCGAPASGVAVRIERHPGPLVKSIWPDELVSDKAGRIHLEGLEAGTHSLTVVETGARHEITIRPAPGSREQPRAISLVVRKSSEPRPGSAGD